MTSSEKKNRADWRSIRQHRDRHMGFCVQEEFMQHVPFFFNREGMNLNMLGAYRGATCFLVCSGPSLKQNRLKRLKDPGVLTMSVNNAVSVVKTNMWICVDEPTHFISTAWLDPTITKFVPMAHFEKPLWDTREGQFRPLIDKDGMPLSVGDMPNVIGFRRNEKFNADRFFFEDTVNWGCCGKWGGVRSVMLASFKVLWLLGIRRINIVGADFTMLKDQPYAFNENKSVGGVESNNNSYKTLNERFKELAKIAEQIGLKVYNCNKDSGLDAFPKISFNKAVAQAKDIVGNPNRESTEGLYQSTYKDKLEIMVNMQKEEEGIDDDEKKNRAVTVFDDVEEIKALDHMPENNKTNEEKKDEAIEKLRGIAKEAK